MKSPLWFLYVIREINYLKHRRFEEELNNVCPLCNNTKVLLTINTSDHRIREETARKLNF